MGKKAKERKRREREAQAFLGMAEAPRTEPSQPSPRQPGARPKGGEQAGDTAGARPASDRRPAVAGASASAAKAPVASRAPSAAKPPKSAAAAPAAGPTDRSGELATRLNSVAIHLLRRLQREDTRLGLSGARLSALSVLVFGGPRTLGKLADAEGVSPPSMTRLVTAMEAEGLVAREKNSADGRSVIIRASAEGERLLIRGREQRVQALAGWLAALTPLGLGNLDKATTTLEELLKSERADRTEATNRDRSA